MQFLDLTLELPAANLALDEALLEEAEASATPHETLRVWEANSPLVVVGRSSKADEEVQRDYCRRQGIPVLRRASGGAAIVAGPGCLMYALVLSYDLRPALRSLDEAHRFVLTTIAEAINPYLSNARRQGTSDLTCGDRKFSGNSVRCKRRHLLYHGTLLYRFPLELVSSCLATAPRQPEYRAGRNHRDFIANLPIEATDLKSAIQRAWQADSIATTWPTARTDAIVAQKYSLPEWNLDV